MIEDLTIAHNVYDSGTVVKLIFIPSGQLEIINLNYRSLLVTTLCLKKQYT